MPRAVLIVCLLWAASSTPPRPALADGPPAAVLVATPAGPVAPATLVTLDATGSTGDDFLFDTDVDDALYRVDSGGKLLYFAAPNAPGVYRFKVESFGITGGKVKVARAKVAVTVGGGPNPVPPTPNPTPPTPTPTPPVPVPPIPPAPVVLDKFRPGDPVTVNRDLADIPRGTPGRVVGKSPGYPLGGVWDVSFSDPYNRVVAIHQDYLDPPGPPPTPTPQAILVPPFTVTIIADDASLTTRSAAIIDSLTIGPAVTSLGGRYHAVKVGSAEYARRGLAKVAGGVSPAVIVQDARGAVVASDPLPTTEADLIARLRSLLGGR